MECTTPNSDEPSKARLLKHAPVIVLESCAVNISPDGTTEVVIVPDDPRIRAELDFDCCNFRPQVKLTTCCPAMVYFSGTVYNVKAALTFYQKDVIGGWNDLIVIPDVNDL